MIDAFRDIFGAYRFRLIGFACLNFILIAITTVFQVIPATVAIILMIATGVLIIRYFYAYTAEEIRWLHMGLDPETGEPMDAQWADRP